MRISSHGVFQLPQGQLINNKKSGQLGLVDAMALGQLVSNGGQLICRIAVPTRTISQRQSLILHRIKHHTVKVKHEYIHTLRNRHILTRYEFV